MLDDPKGVGCFYLTCSVGTSKDYCYRGVSKVAV